VHATRGAGSGSTRRPRRIEQANPTGYPCPAVIASPDDPIVALATPPASSALAVIRVSGAGSLALLGRLIRGGDDLARRPGHTLVRRTIVDGADPVDEVLLALYRAPRSYTGEEGAEIFCHGSLPVIQHLLGLLGRSGFRPAGPGEFTQRAFLNGRMDLTRAEAVNEIVRARTDRARGLALERLSGAIESRIRAARDALIDLRASLEVRIDYPEDEVEETAPAPGLEEAEGILRGLAGTYRQGRIYQEGIAVVIAGATNAGKSSLFNALLRQDRAIVSEVHGTTRDWIEGAASIEGIPVRLFDTAGLRATEDALEREGMRRTERVIASADLVLYLVDATRGVTASDEAWLSDRADPVPLVRVWSKADLPGGAAPTGFLPVSATSGAGLPALERAIADAVFVGEPARDGEPLIDSERQRDLIARALAALERYRRAAATGVSADLLAVDVADALEALGEITGEVTSAEILERMFSSFCVGK
jgi:tRNA modification GTPase